MRSNNDGLAMAMVSIHEELSPKPTREDGLTKARGKIEPLLSLPEEYSSAEEVWLVLQDGPCF